MKNFLLGVGSVILILLLLVLLGFKFIYSPELENSWEAVSAVSNILGVVVSGVLTWIIIFQTKELNKNASKQELLLSQKQFDFEENNATREQKNRELELKISLYDKRYLVYERFIPYTEGIGLAFTASKHPLPDGSRVNSEEIIIESKIKSESRDNKKKRIRQLEVEIDKAGKKEKREKLESEKTMILNELQMETIEYLVKDSSIIKLSEFCFTDEIATSIIKYFEIIFNWSVFRTATEEDVLTELRTLSDNKIIDKMKDLLKLSYENQLQNPK